MDDGWIKTEPIDDISDDGFVIKCEIDTHVYAEPIRTSNDASEEMVPIQNPTSDAKHKHRKRKHQLETSAAVDSKQAGRKSASKREKKSHACDECGKEFSGAYGLNRHKLTHSGLRPYICPVENCGATYRQSSTLKAHQMSHAGEQKSNDRKFFCEDCGKGFLSKFYMLTHQRSKHSGESPYVCVECGQRFARKQNLNRHILEHSGKKPFECDECGMRFYEKLLLKSHKKTHTADGKPFVCAECGKGFYHKTSLNAHRRNHASERPFGCEICGKRFTQKGTLNIHKMIHSDVRHECEICGLGFTQKFTLKTHRLKQHGLSTAPLKQQMKSTESSVPPEQPKIRDKNLLPKIAPRSEKISTSGRDDTQPLKIDEKISIDFPPKSDNVKELKGGSSKTKASFEALQLDETIKIEKSETSHSENEFETNDDDESNEIDETFSLHRSFGEVQSHPIEEVFTVSGQIKEETIVTCEPSLDMWNSDSTTSDDEYENEIVKEQDTIENSCDKTIQRPFSCDKCERKFALVGALKNHQRSHKRANKVKGKQSFICDECGKIFTRIHQLKTHQLLHSGSKPYACKECGKTFTQVGNLRSHQTIHTGERPFTCETCGLTFSRKEGLHRHSRTHSDVRKFDCDLCGKKFKNPNSVKRHKQIHTGERNYGCDICGKTFIDKSYIKFHLRTHTGEKPFACDQCPSTFVDKGQLRRHIAACHRAVGEPSPYRNRKVKKKMKMVDNWV